MEKLENISTIIVILIISANSIISQSTKKDSKKFLLRIDTKLQKIKFPKEKSIFNKNYFDDTISTIWRWYQAVNYLKEKGEDDKTLLKIDLSTHLHDFVSNNPENFELLFQQSFDDYGHVSNDYISFAPKVILELLSIELTRLLAKNYLMNKKFISYDEKKVEAIKQWLKMADTPSNSNGE